VVFNSQDILILDSTGGEKMWIYFILLEVVLHRDSVKILVRTYLACLNNNRVSYIYWVNPLKNGVTFNS
jgi:hypothetical protein